MLDSNKDAEADTVGEAESVSLAYWEDEAAVCDVSMLNPEAERLALAYCDEAAAV